MRPPERMLEAGPEEAEVADALLTDVARREALHDARRVDVEAMDRLGIARRHEFIVLERERDDGGAHRGVLRAHRVAVADGVLGVQAPAAPLAHHVAGEVADLAQPAAGKIPAHRKRERGDYVPQ